MINLRKVFSDTKAECLIEIKSFVSFEVEKYVFLEVERKIEGQVYSAWRSLVSQIRNQCMDQLLEPISEEYVHEL